MDGRSWERQAERGGAGAMRLMLWIMLRLGFRAGRILVWPIALYYTATSPAARRASRDMLRRATGRPAGLIDALRHIATFAEVIYERVFLLAGRFDGFEIDLHGLDLLKSVLAEGSFEVLRMVARHAPVRVRPLMYRANAGMATRLLEALDPALAAAIIDIGRPESMLAVRDALAAGEMVGMLADRAAGGGKRVCVEFLGAPARFPAGPFIALAGLGAPALLFYAIRTGSRRYEVRFARFADRIVLPRAGRAEALCGWVGTYADRLAAECRRHPYNWFNFYPFWETETDASASGDAADPAAGLCLAGAGGAGGADGRS
jgi:predicted LPLAT superfamily acyltransferase